MTTAEISLNHIDRQLQQVLEELAMLRRELVVQRRMVAKAAIPAPRPAPASPTATTSPLITIRQFCDMMGMKDRSWYYAHRTDPGFPKPARVEGEPRLVRAECEAYFKSILEARGAPNRKKRGG